VTAALAGGHRRPGARRRACARTETALQAPPEQVSTFEWQVHSKHSSHLVPAGSPRLHNAEHVFRGTRERKHVPVPVIFARPGHVPLYSARHAFAVGRGSPLPYPGARLPWQFPVCSEAP